MAPETRNFRPLAECLRQNQNFRVLNFSAGERKLKYPGPGFWIQPGIRGSNTTHLFFVLLRASVPPWCKGLVFALPGQHFQTFVNPRKYGIEADCISQQQRQADQGRTVTGGPSGSNTRGFAATLLFQEFPQMRDAQLE